MCEIWTHGMEVDMSSCQITGIPSDVWRAFRRICLEEGISANRKLRELIEAQMELVDDGMDGKPEITESRKDRIEKGECHERR